MIAEDGYDLEEKTDELAAWFRAQPNLPLKIERCVLERFIYAMNGNLNEAKRLLLLNYKMRQRHPKIFIDRDPCDEKSQNILKVANYIPLPGLTESKNKLLLYSLKDSNPDKFDFTESVKMFFMMSDSRFSIDHEHSNFEVPIFDMNGFSLRHLTRAVLGVLKVYMKFVQEAHPVRIGQIHVINCPSYLDRVITVAKPFIKSEVFKMIRFHLPNSNTLYEYFSQDMLPTEYGGKAGSVESLRTKWHQILKEKRSYLMDADYWRVNKAGMHSMDSNSIIKETFDGGEVQSILANATTTLQRLEID